MLSWRNIALQYEDPYTQEEKKHIMDWLSGIMISALYINVDKSNQQATRAWQ